MADLAQSSWPGSSRPSTSSAVEGKEDVDARDKRGHDGKKLQPFPWREAIGFGLGVLKLSPEQFWRMTPRELAYAIEAVRGRAAPLSRARLDEMMRRYPDDR